MENPVDDLMASFMGTNKPNTPAETVAIQVTGYVLPQNGFETPDTARVLGVRWDNGQEVEIALRENKNASRPMIGQFQNDSGSAMPVTTDIGGTIVADRAYLDTKLKAISGKDVPVLNASWLNRVSPDKEQGWAIKCLARVNTPRLKNANEPAQGNYQSITLMQSSKTRVISSLEELDAAVLDTLDAKLRDQDKTWHQRPGAVNAFVRLSNSTQNALIELSGGFHNSPDHEHAQPNTRDMVAKNLSEFAFWQSKREKLATALMNPNYTVEVIPGSTLYVGRKTLQKGMNNKNNGIEGASRDIEGTQTPLFTEMVLGLRRSPKSGLPQVIFAKPTTNQQAATLSGKPTVEEGANSSIASAPAANTATSSAPAAKPETAAPAQSQHTPVSQPANEPVAQQEAAKPVVIRQSKSQESKLLAIANSDAHAETLKTLSLTLNAQYEPNHRAVLFDNEQLPSVMRTLKNEGHQVAVMPLSQQQQNQKPVETVQPQSTQNISASAPAVEAPPPVEQPSTTPQNFDLSTLDLSNLDLDSTLNDAYQEYQQGPAR